MFNPFDLIQGQKKRYLQGTLWALVMIGFSFLFVYLLRLVQEYLNASQAILQNYASLAYVTVFVISLLSNATIFVPAPGIALNIALATQFNPSIVALIAALGGTVGELTGYCAGRVGNKIVSAEHIKGYEFAKHRLERHGYWVISLFALIPIVLFDLVGLVSGALKIPIGKFFIATLVGRIPRSFIEIFGGATRMQLVLRQWFE